MRRYIRGMHRDHPDAQLLVTGCYAQRAPDELAAIEGVNLVVGNSHKTEIANLVLSTDYHGNVFVDDFAATDKPLVPVVDDLYNHRTRPNLKIQDGCSNRCSFCIIPSVRGRSRSASLQEIVQQASQLASRFAEIVLTGINLGRWGRDLPGQNRFTDLIKTLLAETSAQRLRISSVEPMDWNQELLELMAREPRIADHMHIPLQSGSDSVLKRMFRKYRVRHYASRLELARKLMPDASIGADVMAGFPGETEAEFHETVRFIESQPLTYLHVFTYSERPGTAAAEYGDGVPVDIRRERTRLLRELSDRKSAAFRQQMIGKTLSSVTLEQPRAALTSNFLKVELSEPRPANRIVDVAVGAAHGHALQERSLFPVLS